ncbi:hypothetical protein L7F22_014191 [Adiantum nelumboides]|nr:hypothetical protein [Adiantum nelumboides]
MVITKIFYQALGMKDSLVAIVSDKGTFQQIQQRRSTVERESRKRPTPTVVEPQEIQEDEDEKAEKDAEPMPLHEDEEEAQARVEKRKGKAKVSEPVDHDQEFTRLKTTMQASRPIKKRKLVKETEAKEAFYRLNQNLGRKIAATATPEGPQRELRTKFCNEREEA